MIHGRLYLRLLPQVAKSPSTLRIRDEVLFRERNLVFQK